jgi:hypothetical protein
MTLVKLLDCKIIVMCIYRSLDGNFHIFLSKLELVIQKLGYTAQLVEALCYKPYGHGFDSWWDHWDF